MNTQRSNRLPRTTTAMVAMLASTGLLFGNAFSAAAASNANISGDLSPTSSFHGASGKVKVKLHAKPVKGAKATQGTFTVSAKHLPKDGPSLDLIVGGAKVGELHPNHGGNGTASFSTAPHGKSALLGTDPRGKTIILRDTTGGGTDVLVGTVPDDDIGSQACCRNDSEGKSECEDVSPDASGIVTCDGVIPTDANGAPIASCLPDPCNTGVPAPTPPSGAGTTTVCCVADPGDSEASNTECDDSLGECAVNGGVLVQVALPADFQEGDNPCDLAVNPCQSVTATPPPPPASCCVTHGSSHPTEVEAPECEDMSVDACALVGTAPVGGVCAYTDQAGAPASVPCP